MGPGNRGQHCSSHRKNRQASIITRTLVFQDMMLLVTGGEKQKEVRIRAEEERGPSQTQRMSSLAWLLKMQHFRGKKKSIATVTSYFLESYWTTGSFQMECSWNCLTGHKRTQKFESTCYRYNEIILFYYNSHCDIGEIIWLLSSCHWNTCLHKEKPSEHQQPFKASVPARGLGLIHWVHQVDRLQSQWCSLLLLPNKNTLVLFLRGEIPSSSSSLNV